ncbi:DUF6894 family protein [Methylobacterium oxalidis]|uniref:DUF6894 domain-containing protein n=1 Tax=Methylobacterium oxalidis TaxID=944322 RepID=A0A512J2T9_9HYPH|nr:hypothetical protein [Methylobacterium oxalidis]GEP04261.1 hypothetical protein MOX02_22990 [Methylobacterium oxalidis]GJE35079.1 hypothetical protein LDDCCGHA_5297 [Methylobacterium oxalidis]GLS67220.1 hypothetical protein GCM10007888_56030 [Methylobacterium oxalidis]
MTARAYRFHCTDGHVAIIDAHGVRVPSEAQLWTFAEQAARLAMERVGRGLDWSDWIVDVHDSGGRRVLTLAFRDVRDTLRGPALAA